MAHVPNLSTDQLRQRLAQGDSPQLWNVLTTQHFTGEFIPGSRRMPLDTIGHKTAAVPKGAEIIMYCGGPQCRRVPQAAQRLIGLGTRTSGHTRMASMAGRLRDTLSRRYRNPRRQHDSARGGRASPRADRRCARSLARLMAQRDGG